MDQPLHDEVERISLRRLNQLDAVDGMSPAMRECVHEYGFAIVTTLRDHGITNPKSIHHVVKEIWCGPREAEGEQRQRKGRSSAEKHLDWLLVQSGSDLSAATLLRFLHSLGLAVVPATPTNAMVDASLDATNHMGVVSKREKHTRRLRAAITAEMAKYQPTKAA